MVSFLLSVLLCGFFLIVCFTLCFLSYCLFYFVCFLSVFKSSLGVLPHSGFYFRGAWPQSVAEARRPVSILPVHASQSRQRVFAYHSQRKLVQLLAGSRCLQRGHELHTVIIIIIIINPLTARVVWAPQMISQPVSFIFPCSPLPSGTCRTQGLSIP